MPKCVPKSSSDAGLVDWVAAPLLSGKDDVGALIEAPELFLALRTLHDGRLAVECGFPSCLERTLARCEIEPEVRQFARLLGGRNYVVQLLLAWRASAHCVRHVLQHSGRGIANEGSQNLRAGRVALGEAAEIDDTGLLGPLGLPEALEQM